MPRYIFAQIISVITILVGWSVLVGGSILAYLWVDKAVVIAMMPATLSTLVNSLPDYVFLIPTAFVFVFGLIITAVGHILHVSLGNASYPAEDVAGENRRNSYDF